MARFGFNVLEGLGIVGLLILLVLALSGACHGGLHFATDLGFGR